MTDDGVRIPAAEKTDPLYGMTLDKVSALIVDVLRANELHQGHCAKLRTEKWQARTDLYLTEQDCDC